MTRADERRADEPAVTDEATIELRQEMAVVSRRVVAGQTVRVQTTTATREHLVEEELVHETIEIERVPIGRVVDAAPEVRQEGDVTVLPVMEEVLVVERRLVLKEEVRIRRVRTAETHRETVLLREQAATVTRSGGDVRPSATPPTNQPTNQP